MIRAKPIYKENHQAWGIAFRTNLAGAWGGPKYEWCYGHGLEGWKRLTRRAAAMEALMSNNGQIDGSYVPLPLPGLRAIDDLERYYGGPYSSECHDIYVRANEMLFADMNLGYEDLPYVAQGKE
jgi:hypothetical protein